MRHWSIKPVFTIIESPLFTKHWPDYWSEEERGEFAAFIAHAPKAGDLIPGSGGCRKIRWGRAGGGKRGGVRIIYTTRLLLGVVTALEESAPATREELITLLTVDPR